MGWLITCLALLGLLLMTKKAQAGITKMSSNKVETLNDIIITAGEKYKVPTALIKAIIMQESSWQVYAKNPSDPSYGLMGIMPIVAQDYGIVKDWKNVAQAEIDSIYVPQNNIGAGSKLLHSLMSRNTIAVAVEMYNVGERGYNELGRRNSIYRTSVMKYYQNYLNEEAGV